MAVTTVAFSDLDGWLQAQPENTADTPYELTITGLTDSNYTNVKTALKSNNTKYVDLRTTELPEIRNLMEAFRACTTLVYAPSIPSVSTGINYAFYGCSSLKEAPFIPTSCMNYQSSFYNCTSMTKAPVVPDSYNYITQMFYNCTSITHKPLFYGGQNQYNSWNVTTKNWKGTLEQIERNRTMLEAQAESEGFEIQVYDTDRNTLLYTVNWVHISILSTWLASKEENTVNTPYKVYILGLTSSNASDIKTALIANPTKYVDLRNTTIPSGTDCSDLFFDYSSYTGCPSLVYAPVLSSGIISLNAAFMRCLNLKEAPEIPDTVIDMNFAFESCLITEAPVLPSGLIYAISCFQGCANLVSTNNLNISTLTNCMYMFGYCTKLTTVQNLPPNLESMIGMFYGCTSLKTLGSVTIPSTVTNMRSAFEGSGLTNAPVLPEGVTNIMEAFCDCYDLRSVPYIPSTVTSASSCFEGCSALEVIEEFKIPLATLRDNTNFKDMFKDCTSLKEIGYTPHFSNDWKLVYLDFDATSVKGKIYSRNKTSVTIPQTTITKSTLKLPLITDELMFSSISVSDLEDIIEGTNQQQGMLDTNYSWYGKIVVPPTGDNFIMYAKEPSKFKSNIDFGGGGAELEIVSTSKSFTPTKDKRIIVDTSGVTVTLNSGGTNGVVAEVFAMESCTLTYYTSSSATSSLSMTACSKAVFVYYNGGWALNANYGTTNSVTVDNMQSVSSNAVASALGTNYDDSQMQNITDQVTKYAGVHTVYAYRKQNMVYLYFSGVYTGVPTTGTQGLIDGLPSKYRPSQQFNGFAMGGYNGNGSVFGRGSVETNGNVYLQETAWTNATQIRSCVVYFVN